MSRTPRSTLLIASGLASFCATLAGCGTAVTTAGTSSSPLIPGAALHGKVYGGQQPLVGASVYLYAAGNSGYGSAYTYTTGTSLLGTHTVTTDVSGSFNITGDYTCPSSTTEIYIEAVGGTADGVTGDANPNVIMLAALGPCGNLSSSSYITMNELTTVASVWALSPFMTGPANIGTSTTNSIGLTNAFNSVNTLVNIGYGQLNTTTLPAGATIPTAELNTLGNILAACVNQAKGGVAGDNSSCGNLFYYATPPNGTAPTNTLMAALDIALNPGNNVANIFLIASKYAQFGPTTLSSHPTDWTVSIRYTGNAALTATTVPNGIAADQSGNIWVTNDAGSNLVKLSPTGTLLASYTDEGYGPIAIDQLGNAWASYTYLNKITPTGTATTYSGGGLYDGGVDAIAVDGSENIWASSVKYNARGTTITGSYLSEFTNSGTAITGTAGDTGGGLSGPSSIAITTH